MKDSTQKLCPHEVNLLRFKGKNTIVTAKGEKSSPVIRHVSPTIFKCKKDDLYRYIYIFECPKGTSPMKASRS